MNIQPYLDIFEILLATDTIDGLLPIPNVWQDFVIEAIVELVKMCHAYHKRLPSISLMRWKNSFRSQHLRPARVPLTRRGGQSAELFISVQYPLP